CRIQVISPIRHTYVKTIAIIYPGFPHYRNGIIEALIDSKKNKFLFAGDKNGYNNVKPYVFKSPELLKDLKYFKLGRFNFNKGLLAFVTTNTFDGAIVHATPYCLSIILATLILRIKGVKVFNWTHGILSDQKNLKNRTYYLFYKTFFNGLLLYGNNAKNNLVDYGYDEDKIKVIYNSLDYKKQIKLRDSLSNHDRALLRKKLFKRPENYQLIFIGRLTPQKKLDQLIEVIDLLKKEGIEVNLLFVGDGVETQRLQKLASEKSIEENICFFGASYNERENFELIASSDCCIAPGEVGLTAMHTLMFGVPVISHSDGNNQMPEYEAIVPGLNGDLFEKDNVQDLKKTIIGIRNRQMASSLEEIRKNCYKIMDDFYNPYYQKGIIEDVFD
ncbi:MAG: glycosyltransferase, partial [Bacteroidota bacterium]